VRPGFDLHAEGGGGEAGDRSRFRWRSFVRSPALSTASREVHLGALAFLTDEWLLETPALADLAAVGHGSRSVAMRATINHSVLFHAADARADEWMVSERVTMWAEDGRVLVEQRLWNAATGRLVLSSWQEGLVRLREAKL